MDQQDDKRQSRRQSITIDNKEFHLDNEMLDGLFSFKNLLERKLVPSNFSSKDVNQTLTEKEQQEYYELQT